MTRVPAPALSNETVQRRLLTGASSKGGARGSLTRCATKLGLLQARGGSDQAVKDELKRELRLFQVELRKHVIMIQSAQKELQDVTGQEETMAAAVQKKHQDIQELRDQAAKVAKTRLCWQEYETLAKLARQRSPKRVLQAKMAKAKADFETAQRQLYETAAESKVREKQFHLLIQCMLDLKRSLGESVEIPPMKKKKEEEAPAEETAPAEEKKPEKVEAAVQPMDTQAEDDDDLYGGL